MIETPVRVAGDAFHGRYVNPSAQAEFVNRTLHAARDAARFRTCRSSRLRGRPFRFLQAIWDIQQAPWVETDAGDTLLIFRANTLEAAAPTLFEQESLFEEDRLQRNWTVFDLLGQILQEVQNSQAQDIHLDYGMLDSVQSFSHSFHHGLDLARFDFRTHGRTEAAVIDAPLVLKAGEALHDTPASRRIRIAGVLDMLRMSNRLFQIVLDDGAKVRGVWMHDTTEVRSFLGERVLMEGEATFRANGEIVAIQADAARTATGADAAFSRKPIISSVEARRKLTQRGGGAFRPIVGQWPGDETDQEITDYLAAVS